MNDEDIQRLADEAEAGYDLDKLKPRELPKHEFMGNWDNPCETCGLNRIQADDISRHVSTVECSTCLVLPFCALSINCATPVTKEYRFKWQWIMRHG
jgi:hypothetical protein